MNYYGEQRVALRANLHTHSTLSDGRLAPEKVISAYAAEGYDVLAMTDHHQLNDVTRQENHGMIVIQGAELHPLPAPGRSRWHLAALNLPLDFKCLRPFETGETAQEALRKGEFYAAQGPQFHPLGMEGDRCYAEFSESVKCSLVLKQSGVCLIIPKQDAPGTSAECDLQKFRASGAYARWGITDAQGRTAWSNPIYL